MVSYLTIAASQNVLHSEIFFDPQVHTLRGIGFEVFMPGFIKGMQHCQERISATLLMCFMTELGPQDAEEVLDQVNLFNIFPSITTWLASLQDSLTHRKDHRNMSLRPMFHKANCWSKLLVQHTD